MDKLTDFQTQQFGVELVLPLSMIMSIVMCVINL